jgi:aminoglycoside 2''-phosphotransferase
MISSEHYWQEQIHRIFPDLEIEEVELFQEGLVNDVLIVNQQWVIRFTKTAWGKELMEIEDRLMQYLYPRLSIKVPYPVKRGDGILVYELLGGKDFLRECWIEGEPERQDRLAQQLGTFLSELHNPPSPELDWEVPLTLAPVTRETWLDIYERVKEKVCPLLLPHQVHWMDDLFDSAFSVSGFFNFEPVMIHGDLGPYHILYDREPKRLNAVIDFAMAGIGDPATDLGGLISHYGESLVSTIRPYYPLYDSLLQRARFYAQAAEVHWALLGVETGELYWFTAHLGDPRDIDVDCERGKRPPEPVV